MSNRRLAEGQQPSNSVDPDAGGVPKEEPSAAAVLVSREDLASLLNTYDRPANDVTRRLRRAVIESEDAARASVSVTEKGPE